MPDWLETIKLHAAKQAGALGQPRHAIVTSVDAVAHAVKVTIQPEGIESGWIPDAAVSASGLRIACPAEIGSQVLVAPVEGDAEHPVVIARVFDVVTAPPSSPATGKPVQPGELGVFTGNGSYVHISENSIFIKGKVIIDGTVQVNGDIVAGQISLMNHRHVGIQPGQGFSGGPEPSNG